mgnify:CR=1 FL=1
MEFGIHNEYFLKKDVWSDSEIEISKINWQLFINKFYRTTMKENVLRQYHYLQDMLSNKEISDIETKFNIILNWQKYDINNIHVEILWLGQDIIKKSSYIWDKKSKKYKKEQLISSPDYIQWTTLNNKWDWSLIEFSDVSVESIVDIIQNSLEKQLWIKLELHGTNIKVSSAEDWTLNLIITDIGNITYDFINKNKKVVKETISNLHKNLDWFLDLGSNFFAVEWNNNYIVYNSLKWDPFIIDKELYTKIISKILTDKENKILTDMWYTVDIVSDDSREEYENTIKTYIDNYKWPRVLDLSISEMCNLNCHMCIHSYARQKENPRSEKKIMSFETAKMWIDYYMEYMNKNFPEENLSFHFGAAEPLLNKKVLFQCLEYIKQKVDQGKDMDLSINTNLTLFNDQIIDTLSQYDFRINIGLDGNKDQNDSIRVDKNYNGTYNKIIKNVKKIKTRWFNTWINLTLTDRNFNDVNPKEFVAMIKELWLDAMLVDIDFVQWVKNDYKEVVSKLMEFQRIWDEEGINILGNRKAPFLNVTSERSDDMIAFCHASKGKNLAITPSEKLTFCSYTSRNLTDNINWSTENKFNDFVKNMKEYMQEKTLHNSCFSCAIEWLCNGWCHVTQEQKSAVEYMCKVYKESTKELLKYYFGDENANSEEIILAPWAE